MVYLCYCNEEPPQFPLFAGTPVITSLEYVPESKTLNQVEDLWAVDDVVWKKDEVIIC